MRRLRIICVCAVSAIAWLPIQPGASVLAADGPGAGETDSAGGLFDGDAGSRPDSKPTQSGARKTPLAPAVPRAPSPKPAAAPAGAAPSPAAATPAANQLPEPSKADQDKALKMVRDVYRDQYRKKGADERLELAHKMIEVATQGGDEMPTRYVMLTEARDLAAGVGDASTIKSAVSSLASLFAVNESSMTIDALGIAAKQVTEPARATEVAQALLNAADESIARGELETAFSAVTKADQAAKHSDAEDVVARVAKRLKDVKTLRSQYAGLAAAKSKLATAADDPQANTIVGKYLCLIQGDWASGLGNLVQSNDPALKKAADLDLKAKPGTKEQEAAADAWGDIAEKLDGIAKEHVQQRAVALYEQSLPDQTGLRKMRVEKRIASIREVLTPKAADPKTATANGKAKPAAPNDPTLRAFEALVKASPPKLRLQKSGSAGREYDSFAYSDWLEGQKSRFRIDGAFKLREVRDRSTQGQGVQGMCETLGPITVDGVQYDLFCYFIARDKKQWEGILSIPAGSTLQLRGVVADLTVNSWGTTGDGSNRMTIEALMENPLISVKQAKAEHKTK